MEHIELQYQIPYNSEVEKAINHAKMHQEIELSENEINQWKMGELVFPILKIEHLFEINKKYPDIPVRYQYLWFCLDGSPILRTRAGGSILKSKVSFSPIYLERQERILSMIRIAATMIGKKKFAALCGFHVTNLNEWLRARKPPINALIKSCQLLNRDFWDNLDGVKLYGTSGKKFVIFRKQYPENLKDIRIWIENEGNIGLRTTEITFKQAKEGIKCLYKLNNLFYKIFGIKGSIVKDSNTGCYLLRITSSPLRQILSLQYRIPVGYKIYSNISSDLFEFQDPEDGYRYIAKNIETEGCFTLRHKKNFNYLRVSFGSANKERRDKFTELANKLGFNFKNYDQPKRRVYHSFQLDNKNILKLLFYILPYIWHEGKINKIFDKEDKYIFQKEMMTYLRFDVNVKIKNLLEESIAKFGGVAKLNQTLHLEGNNFGYKFRREFIYCWLRGKSPIPLITIIILCNILDKEYFTYLPKWVALVLWTHGLISYDSLQELRAKSFENVTLSDRL